MKATNFPQYPKVDIEQVLSFPDRERMMSCFLADMEAMSLWINPVSRRVGCLGVVYWRAACDGMAAILDENGVGVIRESIPLLQDLGAERTAKVLQDVLALFPVGALPDDYPFDEPALELLPDEELEKLESLDELFGPTFLKDEKVLSLLHPYISKHMDSFTARAK